MFVQTERLPGAAEAICRTLLAAPGNRLKRDSLIDRLRPGLKTRDTVITETLREIRKIGVVVGEDEGLSVCDAVRDGGIEALREAILDAVLRDAVDHDFWVDDEDAGLDTTGGMDLARAATWFLTLPVADAPWGWDGRSSVRQRQIDDADLRVIRNDTRWPFFVRWAGYLGLVSPVADTLAVPDPTRAVRPVLERFLSRQGAVPFSRVVAYLGDALPVLDDGLLRSRLHERVPPPDDEELSSALSFAFLRLRHEGTIELHEGLGDAEKVEFADGGGAFHAVRWVGAAA